MTSNEQALINMKLAKNLFLLLIYFTICVSFTSAIPALGCKSHNIRLTQLMSLLCNTTQANSFPLRDACIACFTQAAEFEPGPRQLLALSQCATIYLTASGYQLCAQNLAAAVIALKPTYNLFKLTPCTLGYCEFVQCVRRTNAAILVNACFVASMVNRDFTRILDRLNFYSNTTACILAKTRCEIQHPITGQLQQQLTQVQPIGLTNGAGTAGFYNHNALQIALNGDIKIVSFPSSVITGDYFCTLPTWEQSVYDGITCIVP